MTIDRTFGKLHRRSIRWAKDNIRPWGGMIHTEAESLDEALEVLKSRKRYRGNSHTRQIRARIERELGAPDPRKTVTLAKLTFMEGPDHDD